jgi:hypothetical protein
MSRLLQLELVATATEDARGALSTRMAADFGEDDTLVEVAALRAPAAEGALTLGAATLDAAAVDAGSLVAE